ncbi:C-type mannose receptor 2 isoform X1 [Fundulus heteroclitus]|uniref:C-type mannose receptor 2 isoform X1 n=1 Tax=Fundulus heteroclitus TaxID=8078 RepID=UPI00165B2E02|nr:C-type mannose receptor 2 isoform X1 [Fundulus heteroclitus]
MQSDERHRNKIVAPTWTTGLLTFYKCTLYLFIFSLGLKRSDTAPVESDDFAFFLEGTNKCLGVLGNSLILSPSCEEPNQRWKWVSQMRLFNLGSSLCLGLNTGNVTYGPQDPPMAMYTCDAEPPRVDWTWNCVEVLDKLKSLVQSQAFWNGSAVSSSAKWRLYGDEQDLCSKTYQEIYTIEGNSYGRPCYLPFMYRDQWFHSCTSTGREDGHLWCATTYNYDTDLRWGFCPVKDNSCETFWKTDSVTDSCYQFNMQATLSWSEARISCQQQGADLLSIGKLHEQTYINGILNSYSLALWIGLNDLDLSGGWQWSDSSPVKFLNWDQDQPSHAEEENCVVLRSESSGRWQNRDCSDALPYACKKRPNATLDPFTTDSWANDDKYECDVGWQSFQAGCYKLSSEKSKWNAAQKTCQKMDASLVSIHTIPELEFIIRNLKKDHDQLWIGLHDTDMQMDFQWTDHTPVIFTYWHPFEPNNFRNTQEDCVSMWGPDGRWDDSPCNISLPFICKKPGTKSDGKPQHQECKQGWKWHSPACYWVGEDLSTFDVARKSCEAQEAALVTITNRFEQAFATSLVFGRSGEWFWIGLSDQATHGSFRWLSGDEVSFTNWNRNQPANVHGGCVAMATGTATGLWEVKECASAKAKFICRQNQDTSLSPEPPAPQPTPSLSGACPTGWKSNSNLRYCYKVFHNSDLEQKQKWLDAHLFCRRHGGNLLSIGNPEEEQFILQVLHETFGESEEHEQQWFWIGLNRRNPMDNGSWKWSDGLPLTYQNFGRYHYNNRQCAAADLGTMTWLAMHCDAALDWICKIPRGSVEVIPEVTEGASSPKWIGFQEAEYKFFDHRTTWDQAKRICSWSGSSLASVHSAEEQAFLANILSKMVKSEVDSWWLGLHTYENDGRFRWSDHSVLNYVSWALGRPQAVSRDRKCIHMSASKGDWADQKCHSDLPYVCKRVNVTGTIPPTPPSPHPPSGCPSGWSFYQHKCFKVFESPRNTWSAAKLKCESQRGALALVSNHLDQAFITTLLKNVSADLWVGLTSDSKGHFRWAKTGLLSYTNWAPGEPVDNSGPHHNKTPGNCVVMIHGNPERKSGMWASRACEMENNGFICQKQPDRGLPPAPTLIPASLSKPVELGGVTYRVVQKRLDWTGALYLCESLNGTLAAVRDPYQQAYLTLLINSLRQPAWISLFNHGGRSFTWLGDEEVKYSNWKDREPNQMAGCGHMTSTGQWTMTPCDAKLDAAICQISDEPISHQWIYPGLCPISVGEWAWVPFRNHCYAFNLQLLKLQQDALSSCKKMGAELLSILDEAENNFVWEHIQSYAEQAHGAWLGISMKERRLVWNEDTEISFTNWETRNVAFSVLSPNSCFWIQSNSGQWKPGSCRNLTHGVICKRPRISAENSSSTLDVDHLPTVIVVIVAALVLLLLIATGILLYRRRTAGSRGSFEGARYSRTNSGLDEQAEKNILVSDMELNEQPE